MLGLTLLQKGNREAILRVRARDAANFVAQHVLDSLGAVGINSLKVIEGDEGNLVFKKEDYVYNFEGKPQLDKNTEAIIVKIPFDIEVAFLEGNVKPSIESTHLTKAYRTNDDEPSKDEINTYAKSLEATVLWEHKGTKQSIKMAKVVR
jgi:FAD/FMN-containing dehydrogenase